MGDIKESPLATRSEPPDGGWGWLVMMACLGSLTIRTGLTWAAFPVFYDDLIQYFHTSSAAIGWAGSMFTFCNFAICLMATPFYEAYGSRVVGVAGTLFSFLGLILTAVAPNLGTIVVTYGLIVGCGIGCVSFASLIPTQVYFTNKRPLAAGVGSMGVGLGQMMFPPIIRACLDHYGWRGTMLISSAVVLHCCLMCATFRPLRLRSRLQKDVKSTTKMASLSVPSTPTPTTKLMLLRTQDADFTRQSQSMVDVRHNTQKQDTVTYPMHLNDKVHRDVNESRNTQSIHSTVKSKFAWFWILIRENIYLLNNKHFLLYVVGNFFMNFGLWTIYTHFTNRAIKLGFSKQWAALLTSLVGIANLISRLVISSCSTWINVQRVMLYGILLLLGGIFCVTTVFAQTFIHQAVWAVLCGLTAGGSTCLQITASTDMVGVRQTAQATSLIMVATAMAVLVALPLAGWLYDITGAYDIPFVVNGGLQIIGACFVLYASRYPQIDHTEKQHHYHLASDHVVETPRRVEIWQSTHSLAI